MAEATIVLPALLFIFVDRKLGGGDSCKLSIAFSYTGMRIVISDFGLNRLLVRTVSGQKTDRRICN